MLFPVERVAIYVDGCFWHGCPEHGTMPRANGDFWARKLEENRRRDLQTDAGLADAGWYVVRVWEHEDPEGAAMRVTAALREVRAAMPGSEPR